MRIDKGVYTSITVDTSGVDFDNVRELVLTVKNKINAEALLIKKFEYAGTHTFDITPEQSEQIKSGAVYDIDLITLDGKRYKITDNEQVEIREAVGNVSD